MVGLVVVSHSMELAEAVVALVDQVARGRVRVVPVGGTEDLAQPFGSDAAAISKAILRAHSPDGVVVLMDLGSSVMSAELALELLPEDIRADVHLCPGPLVEGAVVAGIQAACGSSVERVLAEASEALRAKALLLERADRGERDSDELPVSRSERREVRIGHPEGLHARPAAEVVKAASQFKAEMHVSLKGRDGPPADLKSIIQVLALGAERGDVVTIEARGEDAIAALSAVESILTGH